VSRRSVWAFTMACEMKQFNAFPKRGTRSTKNLIDDRIKHARLERILDTDIYLLNSTSKVKAYMTGNFLLAY